MHLESFGGCMLGPALPAGLLVALSVLEALFFRQHGLRSISLSYAQQTHPGQDLEAVAALRRLAGELLPELTGTSCSTRTWASSRAPRSGRCRCCDESVAARRAHAARSG